MENSTGFRRESRPSDLKIHGLPYLTSARRLITGKQTHKFQRAIENKQNGNDDADSSKIFRGHVYYQRTGISTVDYRPILEQPGSTWNFSVLTSDEAQDEAKQPLQGLGRFIANQHYDSLSMPQTVEDAKFTLKAS